MGSKQDAEKQQSYIPEGERKESYVPIEKSYLYHILEENERLSQAQQYQAQKEREQAKQQAQQQNAKQVQTQVQQNVKQVQQQQKVKQVQTQVQQNEKKQYLYVLELEGGKYYVGITNNVQRRVEQHKRGEGAEWTKKYKMVKLAEAREMLHPTEEDAKTKELMSTYGIENVRGGAYTSCIMREDDIKSLKKEISHFEGRCFKCNEKGHFAKECKQVCERCGRNTHMKNKCYAKTMLNGTKIL